MTRPPAVMAVLLLAGVVLAACAGAPEPAADVLDRLEAAGLVDCDERREPVPDVITCEDEAGDLTVGLTETGVDTVRSTARSALGPWIVGDDFVVITYDDDADRAASVRDAIGSGDVWTVDDDGEPILLAD